MNSYSQSGEDLVVFNSLQSIEGLCVLDIGAGHPKNISNSLGFIEAGCRTVLVEPSPTLFAALLAEHAGRENVKLVHVAVGAERRMVPFYEASDPHYSTAYPAVRDKWEKTGIVSYKTYWVSQVTVRDLVNEVGVGAEIVSIDAEGASFDILTQCPLGEWGTQAIIIEHDGRIVELCAWGDAHGYRPKKVNAENIVFIKE